MTDRACAHHPSNPAIAICSGCGEDICARCHRTTMTGYALCTTCESKLNDALRTRWETASTPLEHVYGFAWTAVAVLSSSRAFFGSMPPLRSWLKPAAFGCIAYGIGTYASALWSRLFLDEFQDLLAEPAAQLGVSTDTAFVIVLLGIPFATPIALALHAALLHIACRVAGARSDWRLIARIVSFASAAYLFQVVPPIAGFPIGYMLSIVWLVNIELVAIQHYFQLGLLKSMAVVFVPFMLLVLMGL